MKIKKIPLLAQIIAAIILGVICGNIFPEWLSKIFATINGVFSNLLSFIIPMLILGLIAPGIADVGKNAGRLLAATAAIAYTFTLFAGFFTFFTCKQIYPSLIGGETLDEVTESATALAPYFTIEMPPLFGVMSALIAAFLLGVGMTAIKGTALRNAMGDFKSIIVMSIEKIIVPFLPLYIFGIFLSMTQSGQIAGIFAVFIKIIVLIFAITIIILLLQYSIAGAVSKKNPLKMLKTMMVAYFTALGTQSSAATIPVTLAQTKKNGVREDIADFVIPLCATIHLSGSTLKIVACAMAIMMLNGMQCNTLTMAGFICMLGVTMVAAPGVPGGAIMASLGLLETMLGFDQTALGLMIALYIAMDSFGTATNVTGDCAVAVIIEQLDKKESNKRSQ